MTPLLVPMLQTWAEIRTDVAQYWYIYVSMPFIAARLITMPPSLVDRPLMP